MEPRVLAIDLGGTNVKAAIVDGSGRILEEDHCPTESHKGPDAVLHAMTDLSRRLLERAGLGVEDLVALGVGAPGPLDSKSGIILRCPNLPGWENLPVAERLSAALKLPVHLENDANAAALAEAWVGAGKGRRHVICLTLGTGVGSGVVVDGRLLKGRGLASEIGHMIIREGGRRCGCGARGCFESYASATAVVARAEEALDQCLADGGVSSLAGKVISCKAVFDAAGEGDGLAARIVEDTAQHLAVGLASLIHVFHPEVIVLTGGMIRAGERALLEPARRHLWTLAMSEFLEGLELLLSPLADRAGVLGAAAVALRRSGSGCFLDMS